MLWATTEQLFYKCLAAFGTVTRILHAGVYDLFIDGKRIFRSFSEGQFSTEKFISDDTEGPQINVEAVALSCDDLRGHVMRCAYDGIGSKSTLNF